MTVPAPDPHRLGGVEWLRATQGVLTRAERRRLLGAMAVSQGANLADRLKLSLGRRPDQVAALDGADLAPPDSRLAREAEEACDELTPGIIGHSYRTWAFGQALAVIDGAAFDRELFYCAALLHDSGLLSAVAGQDFTLRSGKIAVGCARRAGLDELGGEQVADAIAVHATPGCRTQRVGALGTYVQAGALVDLAGSRLCELPSTLVERQLADHPRAGLKREISALIRAEAKAVPKGRFALLNRWGFRLAIRMAPYAE